MKRMNEMGDFDVNPNVCLIFLFWLLYNMRSVLDPSDTVFMSCVFSHSFVVPMCLPCVRVRTVVGRSDGSDARGDSSSDGIHGH